MLKANLGPLKPSRVIRPLVCATVAVVLASAGLVARQAAPDKFAKPPIEILTPQAGVDFTGFVDALLSKVRRNWYAVLPDQVRRGDKGIVSVRLEIQQDGTLVQAPLVETGSGEKPLDDAAVSAIRASAPFDRLPPDFKGPSIELRMFFYYNLPPPEQKP